MRHFSLSSSPLLFIATFCHLFVLFVCRLKSIWLFDDSERMKRQMFWRKNPKHWLVRDQLITRVILTNLWKLFKQIKHLVVERKCLGKSQLKILGNPRIFLKSHCKRGNTTMLHRLIPASVCSPKSVGILKFPTPSLKIH